MPLLYALLSAIFASFVAIFAKLGLKNIDSTLATAIRATIMAIFMIGVVLITHKLSTESIKNIDAKDWVLIILSGVAGAISWIFYFLAIKESDSTSKVAAIDKLSIVFVFIFALIFLKEKFEIGTLIGIGLMSIGAVIISLQ